MALGISGNAPLFDYPGKTDSRGYELRSSMIAMVDVVPSAAEPVKGKLAVTPVASSEA